MLAGVLPPAQREPQPSVLDRAVFTVIGRPWAKAKSAYEHKMGFSSRVYE